MSSVIAIAIPGTPQGKGRPRFGQSRTFTPDATRAYESAVRLLARAAMRGRAALTGPVVLAVLASFSVPRSWSKTKTDQALRGLLRPTARPDWDNVGKITDALNGIVWEDDAQVVEAIVTKVYASQPALLIRVWPWPVDACLRCGAEPETCECPCGRCGSPNGYCECPAPGAAS